MCTIFGFDFVKAFNLWRRPFQLPEDYVFPKSIPEEDLRETKNSDLPSHAGNAGSYFQLAHRIRNTVMNF